MISIEKCKSILKSSSRNYTDDEIKCVRDFLYSASTIEYELFESERIYEDSNVQEGVN